jgi:hypothetical protein
VTAILPGRERVALKFGKKRTIREWVESVFLLMEADCSSRPD